MHKSKTGKWGRETLDEDVHRETQKRRPKKKKQELETTKHATITVFPSSFFNDLTTTATNLPTYTYGDPFVYDVSYTTRLQA